jgi:acyl-CoA oxidase
MMIPHVEKATCPWNVIQKLKPLVLLKHFFKKPYGVGTSCVKQGALILELARVDPSLVTFFIVQAGLLGFTVETLGSEEQKEKYLPKIINLDLIGGWALTEQNIGSDASNLEATSTKTEKGYKLNGVKRWMGNANRDLLVVFAKN